MLSPALLERLDHFLAARVKHDRGWTKVSSEDLNEFIALCQALRDAKWDRDEDGDPTIEIEMVNRAYGRRPWVPVLPYCHYATEMTPEIRQRYLAALSAAEAIIKNVRITLEQHL